MRILQVNQTCGIGSTGKIAVGIADCLEQAGNEAYIAYGYYFDDRDKTIKLKRGNKKYSLLFEFLKCRITGYYGFTSKAATYKLIKHIEEIKPDIIHLHNIHGGFVHIEVLFDYLAKKDIPIVWTLHDCWSFTGHCAHFDYIKCEKWKTECCKCPQKKTYPRRWFFDRSEEQYARKKAAFTKPKNITFVTPSKWLAGLVKQSFFKDYPICTINNGINLEVFKPTENNIKQKFGIEDKKLVLAVAATWSQRKGYEYIHKLAEVLGDDYKVCIIGLNERQLKSLPENIIGIGRTQNQKELAEFYTAADVFVNCTLEEVLGLVNIEALACGTPVVTFDTGGSPECINDEVGVIVEKENLQELHHAVKLMAQTDISSLCIKYAKRFDEKEKYKDYLTLYKEILNIE